MVWYIQYLWCYVVEWGRENMGTNEEHDEDGVEEGFQLVKVKSYKDGEGGREALGMRSRSINIWDELQLELGWSKRSN